jgi:hypothetical protein
MAIQRVGVMLMAGVRPRELPEDLIRSALVDRPPPALATMALMQLYYRALDCHNPTDAVGRLNELEALIQERRAIRTVQYLAEAAYCTARFRLRAKLAERVLRRANVRKLPPGLLLRVRAAIALAEGQWDEAARCASEAARHLSMLSEFGHARAEEDWLGVILATAALGRGARPSALGGQQPRSDTSASGVPPVPDNSSDPIFPETVEAVRKIAGLTLRLRIAIVLAQDEAMRLRHDFVGTEHLLVGLTKLETSIAVRAMKCLGADPVELRRTSAAEMEPGDEAVPEASELTPQAQGVLEQAVHEARELGHAYVGTEHVLLGLVCNKNGNAAAVLARCGVAAEPLRAAVAGLLDGVGDRAQAAAEAARAE